VTHLLRAYWSSSRPHADLSAAYGVDEWRETRAGRRPMREHVDLFSGIGGFALAARECGLTTITFCESDQRCREFLSRAWPGVPCQEDIKTFDGRQFAGAFLLTGGPPCQPASRAGKQTGAGDNRWLWPETLRVLAEVRPTWTLLENPPGIGDMGLAGILVEMEGLDYEVRVLGIPACGVGAPHRRERYWIIGRRNDGLAVTSQQGCEGPDAEPGADGLRAERPEGIVGHPEGFHDGREQEQGGRPKGRIATTWTTGCFVADSKVGRQRIDGGAQGNAGHADECSEDGMEHTEVLSKRSRLCDSGQREQRGTQPPHAGAWSRYVWMPCADGKFRRAPDDSIGLVDGLHRSVLGALGNSIVPQVAARIIAAMTQADGGTQP